VRVWGIPAFLREFGLYSQKFLGFRRKWNFGTNKWSLVQGAYREMSASHDVVSLREVNAYVTESSSCYTPAQQSMQSSNPFACTSCFSAVVAELIISRAFSWKTFLFMVHKFRFRRAPKISGNISQSPPKGWDSPKIS